MPQNPDWKQALEAGMQFTEMRRTQARRMAADLVAQGKLARDQMQGAVDEILELSKRRTEDLRDMVRTEVQRQLGVLGIATKEDLARIERKLNKVSKAAAKKKPASKKPAGKKVGTTAKKAG